MLKLSSSTSTNTGVAPNQATASAVAANVKLGQSTASPWRPTPRHQDEAERVRAVGAGDDVLGAAESWKRDLQLAHLRPHDVVAMCQHALDRLVDIVRRFGRAAPQDR